MNEIEFRKQLDNISSSLPTQQPNTIRQLNSLCSHSISLESNQYFINAKEDCFRYIFKNIIPKHIWAAIEQKHQKNDFNSENFISSLISRGLLVLHAEQREDDKIVVYFEGDKVKHFGRIDNDKIISKWGNYHVWRHKRWEIPLSYGNSIKYSTGSINLDILETALK